MFKLDFDIPPSIEKITHKDNIYLLGSCFSSSVHRHLVENKFSSTSNPFGTIFNPISLFKLLSGEFKQNDYVESQGIWYHWHTHGQISGTTKKEAEQAYIQASQIQQSALKNLQVLVITLGSAIVYELKSSGTIVANCHKVPQSQFKKRFLGQSEIIYSFRRSYEQLKSQNPKLKIILTVSPVKHVKDGLIENNRSKSILIDAVHQIKEQYPDTSYFPAYEIQTDELRDYRFYKRDMIHPSDQAVRYIWNRFQKTYFADETLQTISHWQKLKSDLSHKPLHPKAEKHRLFLNNLLKKLEEFNSTLNISEEIAQVKKQLSGF